MIQKITIIGGQNRIGEPEPIQRIDLKMGDVVSVVGPTGSGKTTLINDIECFADGNTPTKRRIFINDQLPPPEFRENPALTHRINNPTYDFFIRSSSKKFLRNSCPNPQP
jgi:ABC-type lipoprotein export system ATPase subunit